MAITNEQLQSALPSQWAGDTAGISREFGFASYEAGVAFAVQVALMAQRIDHHPDALTIGWKTVKVTYVTHSAGQVTKKDLAAAREVNALLRDDRSSTGA